MNDCIFKIAKKNHLHFMFGFECGFHLHSMDKKVCETVVGKIGTFEI